LQHFYKSPKFTDDWFSFSKLYSDVVRQFPSGSKFVEVGCYEGRSSAYMAVEIANSKKDIEFYCVDIWLDGLHKTFTENMESVKDYYTPIHMSSDDAAQKFENESLDFVFIDADHHYDSVKRDIEVWWPKVKPGGILAGHDFYPHEPTWGDVAKVVKEMFPKSHIPLTSISCFKVNKLVDSDK